MARPISYVIGNGGHAHVIASCLRGEVVFVALNPSADQLCQTAFLDDIGKYQDASVYIGIGNNAARRRIFDRIQLGGLTVATCVAPSAFVARDASIGEGAFIGAGAVVGSRAQIGDNAIVNTLSAVDHDCFLDEDTQVTAGVAIGGAVKVGSNCFFGIHSAVLPNLSIGNNTEIMAGALVTRSLENDLIAGGSPARIVRQPLRGPLRPID